MPLVTQSEYARHRGVSRVTVHLRTMPRGGPIPVYGARRLIDQDQADALWETTMSAKGAAAARRAAAEKHGAERQAQVVTGSQLAQARAAALVVDVQTKRLNLEQRRGALISRDRVLLKTFAFARTLRDLIQAWPARVGPELAAAFDLDAPSVTIYLDDRVRQLLDELAAERIAV